MSAVLVGELEVLQEGPITQGTGSLSVMGAVPLTENMSPLDLPTECQGQSLVSVTATNASAVSHAPQVRPSVTSLLPQGVLP